MLPQRPSLLRSTVMTTAALVVVLGVERIAPAQQPTPAEQRGPAGDVGGGGPIVPESLVPRVRPQGTRGDTGTTQPVLTPGYFEVVCPAICYGGAFRVCNVKAFAGAGYYGPFRRYWAYGTYGPSFNIGPDNSLQYGQLGGVMYVVQRACKGCYKHGGDCACHCVLCPKGGGSLGGIYGPISQLTFLPGVSQQPVVNLSQTMPNSASQQPETLPPQPETLPPPTLNSAHLRLRVPQNADVLVEGSKTLATGTVREFVSPPLQPGKNMIYSILVRYTDGGKKIEETHSIRVHANDRLDIDCTHQPAAQARVDLQPRCTHQPAAQARVDSQPRATALRP